MIVAVIIGVDLISARKRHTASPDTGINHEVVIYATMPTTQLCRAAPRAPCDM